MKLIIKCIHATRINTVYCRHVIVWLTWYQEPNFFPHLYHKIKIQLPRKLYNVFFSLFFWLCLFSKKEYLHCCCGICKPELLLCSLSHHFICSFELLLLSTMVWQSIRKMMRFFFLLWNLLILFIHLFIYNAKLMLANYLCFLFAFLPIHRQYSSLE